MSVRDWQADEDLVNRMKSGEPFLALGRTVDQVNQLQMQALAELRNDNALLRQALTEAAIPLEVLHALGNRWSHPRLSFWWQRLVTDDLRHQIRQAVTAIRETMAS